MSPRTFVLAELWATAAYFAILECVWAAGEYLR